MTDRVLNALFMLLFASNPRRVARARASFVTMWMAVLVSVPMLSRLKGISSIPCLATCSPILCSLRSAARAAAAFLAMMSPRVVLEITKQHRLIDGRR